MECQEWQGKQNNFESVASGSGPETLAVEQPGCDCKDEMEKRVFIFEQGGKREYLNVYNVCRVSEDISTGDMTVYFTGGTDMEVDSGKNTEHIKKLIKFKNYDPKNLT